MKTEHMQFLGLIRGHQWLIRPEALKSLAFNFARITGGPLDDVTIEDFFVLRPDASFETIGDKRIAHVWIQGVLVCEVPPILEKIGLVTTYATIAREMEQAMAADAVVLHINSPGGTVVGNREVAEMIASFGKPIVGHVNECACSAAYKIAAGCQALIATPSAQVGNIGTILSWPDDDKFWEDMGIVWKALVSEGADLKSTFHLEPNQEQLQFLQESIDEAGFIFRSHIQAQRPNIDEEVWRAGWYSGEHAEGLGLVDALGTAGDALAAALAMAD